ncbi:hypothetical protein BJ170DRAFT_682031 [Xylariales sp. AK1849]|nr:hypothetical protein BJ170DRAFT_682031 [Xylariales sp. AK1849]
MGPSLPSKSRKSRSNGQDQTRTVVEPTLEQQTIYNQIREDEARLLQRSPLQEHVDSHSTFLRPPDPRAPSMSRSTTNESHVSGSLSPASTTDLLEHTTSQTVDAPTRSGKRPRGRRNGPLEAEKRFKTAIKRKLGLVCDKCKEKKITCNHYDLSRLEEIYEATVRVAQSGIPASSGNHRQGPGETMSPAPTDRTGMLFGLGDDNGLAAPVPFDDDLGELPDALQRPNSRQENIQLFVETFDPRSLRLGSGTLQTSVGQPYNPGLGTSDHLQPLSGPFPIGREMLGYPARWQCEYSNPGTTASSLSDDCSWTGPLKDLEQHFVSEHHPFQDGEYWCRCISCDSLVIGWDPPAQCIKPGCSPYGRGTWQRWLYAHHSSIESTVVSTPALTQSGESEGGHSFDPRGSRDQSSLDGQNSSMNMYRSFGGGAGYFHQHSECRGASGHTSNALYSKQNDFDDPWVKPEVTNPGKVVDDWSNVQPTLSRILFAECLTPRPPSHAPPC